ncbi:MAG TPA: prephenate dehydrogenase/arogenate dehydrogenase family protein [Actinomycetota bacterium]|nr:prephenate dehydrogenase/arogenate dehydrogenase family protein [Actinomycetota bacterium]
MTSVDRVAVVGTGLIGTSIALAAVRAGASVSGWDADPSASARASTIAGLSPEASIDEVVRDADVVVVATPIPTIATLVGECLAAAPEAVVTDVGSVKTAVVRRALGSVPAGDVRRFVPGHPMGGSERSGPEHASASVVDGIVWAITPHASTDPAATAMLEDWVAELGARPVRLDPERHDRLVAFVSHLPQVASTALMELAATEEADEPEILLLAAGGFRDLTRLAASNPTLWSEILLANRRAIGEAIDLYTARLVRLREEIVGQRGADVEATFEGAKRARLRLGTKPTVRAGVAVLQIEVPDRPGALADLTAALGHGEVNIEDLQIVHSPEGGRGTVHLTVAAGEADRALGVLADDGLDPIRLA